MTAWNKIGRALAIVAIVLSVLGIAAMLLGIVVVWRTNGPITDSLVELASLAEEALQAAISALDAVDPVLSDLRDGMRQVQEATQEIKADIEDSAPIIAVLSALVGEDITPKVEEAAETLGAVHQAARDLNAAALAINNLPFVDIEGITQATQDFLDLFEGIEAMIDELDAGVKGLKTDIVEGAVQPLQELAVEVETGLAEVQAETRDLTLRVESAHRTVTTVKSRLPLIIDIISLLLTMVLLWGILAQAALIYLSWLYRRTNRLDLHRVLAEPIGAADDVSDGDKALGANREEADDAAEEMDESLE